MSIRNSDITTKIGAAPSAGLLSRAPGVSDTRSILTPNCLYSWAHELCEGSQQNADLFLQAYDAHIQQDSGPENDLISRSIPSLLGWHLAVQSLRRMASPSQASPASRNKQLLDHWQGAPRATSAVLMMPWIAGFTAFQTILLQMILLFGGAPGDAVTSRLMQSLSYSNLVLSEVSSKFQGLRPHAEFGSSIQAALTHGPHGAKKDIGFLDGSDLYEFCREALRHHGIDIE